MDERLQMERVRELDMEQLEVEEVDDDGRHSSSSEESSGCHDGGGTGSYGRLILDTGLASMHAYLGEVDDTHHRMPFLDGGTIIDLPMFYLEGIVLFPEATIPFRVIQPRFVAAVERAMGQVDAPCLIGVVRVHRSHANGLRFASVGTTAEIKQYRRLEDGSLNIVARGQQRFHVLKSWIDVEGAPCAQVEVVNEETPLRTPKDAFGQLASIINFQSGSVSHVDNMNTSHRNEESDCDSAQSFHSAHSVKKENVLLYCSESDRMDESTSTSHRNEESDCDSAQSFHSAHSVKKENVLLYCSESDRMDESTSGSDDEYDHALFNRLVVSHLAVSGRPSMHPSRQSASDNGSIEQCAGTDRGAIKGGKSADIGQETAKQAWAADESKWLCRAQKSFWPHWVYKMYDVDILARRAADMWRQIIGYPNIEGLIRQPMFLSFFIASKIPVSDSTKQELLEIDGIAYRLQREIQLLEHFDRVRCKHCLTVIARRSDMLVMSRDGPSNAFVNPHGYVYEIMTLKNTKGLVRLGGRVTEHSWFPGYAWTIVNCATCESNMGWLFTATNKRLQPRSFWGIRSSQLADNVQ
ncbi:cereblon protein [Nymphaea thermarum]|nr:cereblon protein [Nymphaea thermarum]